eukprot:GILK01008288.1.p1 GENE.GILK01008288.1~~GILK01008288.1.p1  ORF type:complete len:384 (+),score=36.15 GILK01008288.1:36-1154(+)
MSDKQLHAILDKGLNDIQRLVYGDLDDFTSIARSSPPRSQSTVSGSVPSSLNRPAVLTRESSPARSPQEGTFMPRHETRDHFESHRTDDVQRELSALQQKIQSLERKLQVHRTVDQAVRPHSSRSHAAAHPSIPAWTYEERTAAANDRPKKATRKSSRISVTASYEQPTSSSRMRQLAITNTASQGPTRPHSNGTSHSRSGSRGRSNSRTRTESRSSSASSASSHRSHSRGRSATRAIPDTQLHTSPSQRQSLASKVLKTEQQLGKLRQVHHREHERIRELTRDNEELMRRLVIREDTSKQLHQLQEDYKSLLASFQRSEAIRHQQKDLITQLKAELDRLRYGGQATRAEVTEGATEELSFERRRRSDRRHV